MISARALIATAEYFAGGKESLWNKPESDFLSQFLSNLIGYARLIPSLSLHTFGNVFRELLVTENYRRDEPHRRILILGQLESRLIVRDVMILGGLNEGTWPRDTGHDPWMSRPMRKNFGLPSAERVIGLSALDFVEHTSNPRVILTRSLKADGTATVPARWLQKLQTLLKTENNESGWKDNNSYLALARKMDEPPSLKPLSEPAPSPCPPLSVRPKKLSATTIEKWMKNPYRLYAEKILHLNMLDAVDEDRMHAERGDLVHDVLMQFVQNYSGEIPPNAKNILMDLAQEKLHEKDHIEEHWHYWWPRLERLMDVFLQEEAKWRKDATPWIQELRGEILLEGTNGFVVTAKADRIDRLKAGGAAVMDYKTGQPPSLYKVKNGTAPQLAIESLILQKGGYKDTPMPPEKMLYWRLSGSYSAPCDVRELNLDMGAVVNATEAGLTNLVKSFENPETPYSAQAGALRYDDERAYAHLAPQIARWSSGESGEDEESEGGTE